MTKRAYKERLYPTPEQADLLAKSFGCARFVWNNTLAYRTEAYQQRSESVSHSAAEKRLVALKAEYPWLKDVSSVILQQALRDQKSAFDNFFNPKRLARRAGSVRRYPAAPFARAAETPRPDGGRYRYPAQRQASRRFALRVWSATPWEWR